MTTARASGTCSALNPSAAREPVPAPAPPDAGQARLLASYSSRLAMQWLSTEPSRAHRRVHGTLVYVDVSGFTALTERLAARGAEGAEEMNGIIASAFGEMGRIAAAHGGDLMKWGGDAAVFLFASAPGEIGREEAAARGARSAWLMTQAVHRSGRRRTSAGPVKLDVSAGVHTGAFELFLVGQAFKDLVVTGPGATRTVEMESAAGAGQVVVSPETAARLGPAGKGEPCGPGVLLCAEPDASTPGPPGAGPAADHHQLGRSAIRLLPERFWRYLLAEPQQVEHRPVSIGFVKLSGLDDHLAARGATQCTAGVDRLVSSAQRWAQHYEVTYHSTDISADGFTVFLLAGVPTLAGDDTDRLLATIARTMEDFGEGAPGLQVRAGANAGKLFVSSGLEVGPYRVYSVTGDALNLAARVASFARPGQFLCTEAAFSALRSPVPSSPVPPFAAKGKSEPVPTRALDVRAVAGGVPAQAAIPAPPASPVTGPAFVGRELELAQLVGLASEVASRGRGQVVELIGPAGIGKSRLLDEAIGKWPLRTWRATGDAVSGDRPYRLFGPLLAPLLGLDAGTPPQALPVALHDAIAGRVPRLLPWAPLVGDVFHVGMAPTPEVEDLEPSFRRARLEAVFVEFLSSLCDGPVALVFEDVHSLDEATASLVGRLGDNAEHAPWLVVTTRREATAATADGTAPVVAPTVIELSSLDEQACLRLVDDLADTLVAPADRHLFASRAAGNPLFLIELARAARAMGGGELPGSLERLLAARLDRLSPPDRALLRAAAVLGLTFSAETLAEVTGEVVPRQGGVWERVAEFVRGDGDRKSFTHALVRDAAYSGLPFAQRRRLHARAGEALEAYAGEADAPVELLAVHWHAARRWDRAWERSREAGERAAALYANTDAANHLRRALDAGRQLRRTGSLGQADICSVAERLGDVCELAGDFDRAWEAYKEASKGAADDVDRARLLRKLGMLYEHRGRYSQALRCHTRALTQLGPAGTPGAGGAMGAARERALRESCEAHLAAAGARFRQGRFEDSAAEAEKASRDAQACSYRRGLAHSLYLHHVNTIYLGQPDDAIAARALETFSELDDLVGQGNVLNNLGVSAHLRGDWAQALSYYRASGQARERCGDLIGAATEQNNIGEILADQGHYEDAAGYFRSAQSAWRAARYRVGEALARSNLGWLAARQGDVAGGTALLLAARVAFEQMNDTAFVDDTDLRLAECALMAADTAGARRRAAALAKRFDGPKPDRRLATALRLRALATALAEGEPGPGGGGKLGAAGASKAAALADLDRSAELLRESGNSYELARTLLARASLAPSGRSRDEEEAKELLAALGAPAGA